MKKDNGMKGEMRKRDGVNPLDDASLICRGWTNPGAPEVKGASKLQLKKN